MTTAIASAAARKAAPVSGTAQHYDVDGTIGGCVAAGGGGGAAAAPFDGRCLTNPHSVREWLALHSHRKQLQLLDKFLHELRCQRLNSNNNNSDAQDQQQQQQENSSSSSSSSDARLRTAHKTVNLLRHMIGSTPWRTAAELLFLLRGLGCELQRAAGAWEPVLANVVRRVMAAAREEAVREAQEEAAAAQGLASAASGNNSNNNSSTMDSTGGRLSLQSMMWALPQHVRTPSTSFSSQQRQESWASEADFAPSTGSNCYPATYYVVRPNLKQAILEAIQEIMTDLEDLHRNINEQVTNHIHAGEILLTCGDSKTIELFLKAAHSKITTAASNSNSSSGGSSNNKFTVIVCGGYDMACRLAEAGIDTTYMEMAAVFAIMSRVHKVLLPAHAVLANGGLVASSGCNLAALAAHQMSVPVVCVTGLFKLCPMFPHEGQDTLQDLTQPPAVLDEALRNDPAILDRVEFVNPMHDYIEPKYVTLYITNVGSFQPSFIYRLLAETYHNEDWTSFD
jgi:translation initiation factor eIF-2B subunit beta